MLKKIGMVAVILAILFPISIFAVSTSTLPITARSVKSDKDRKMVLSSDGKIALFYNKGASDSGQLYYITSEDGGATWSSAVSIGGSSYTSPNSSVWKDTLNPDPSKRDDIFIVVDGYFKVWLRKMTYSGGNWTLGTQTTVVSSTGGTPAYSNCSIAVESTGKMWVNYCYYNGTTEDVHITYSDDGGTTWKGDTAGNANEPQHYVLETNVGQYAGPAQVFIYNNNPAVFDARTAKLMTFDGATWSTQTIPGVSSAFSTYSFCLTSNNYIHFAWSTNGANIKHTYYDGTTWPLGASPNTLQGSASINPNLATDGTNVWSFWSNTNSSPSDIVFKKYDGTVWDSTATQVTSGGKNKS